ncbi:SRR1-domain-containing protein, partial [Gymnopilus junonius]
FVEILENSWNTFSAAPPSAILCLGLGSPTASQNARIQLAFLTETCKLLNVAHSAISIYDPVFTQEDTAFLEKELQMTVLSKENARFISLAFTQSANYTLTVPTLCFMPHCDIELYDALLRANWCQESLPRLFLLGNQLREYLENKSTRTLESTVPYLLRAAPLLTNRPLPISNDWPTAFNNTSAQYFRSQTDIEHLVAERRPQVAETVEDRNKQQQQPDGVNAADVSKVSSPRPTPSVSE